MVEIRLFSSAKMQFAKIIDLEISWMGMSRRAPGLRFSPWPLRLEMSWERECTGLVPEALGVESAELDGVILSGSV